MLLLVEWGFIQSSSIRTIPSPSFQYFELLEKKKFKRVTASLAKQDEA